MESADGKVRVNTYHWGSLSSPDNDATVASSPASAGDGSLVRPVDSRPGCESRAAAASSCASSESRYSVRPSEDESEGYCQAMADDGDSDESACSCPDAAGLRAMLERLAKSKACFVSQQRGERDLSVREKMRAAHGLLHRSPASFLNKFGPYCGFIDVEYLRNFRGDYQVDHHLNRLLRRLTHKDRATVVKNRRYGAVARLEADGYFDEYEMKRRDPLLYDQMVGRYLTEDEVKAEADRQMRDYRFSSWLMQQADSKDTSTLYQWQLQQEQQQTEEAESDDEEADEADKLEKPCSGGHPRRPDEAERNALREEFLHIMQERFIDGEDNDFDYGQVDDNDEYDDIELETADAEAQYFDVEEPETVDSVSESSSPETNGNAAGDGQNGDSGSVVEYDY